MHADEDAALEIDDPLDVRRTLAFFLGEHRVLYGDSPSKDTESSALFENKFIRANLVTIGILNLSSLIASEWACIVWCIEGN